MSRIRVWLQLLVGWLPLWALFSALIVTAHPGTRAHRAVFAGMRAVACAAVLGLLVHRLTRRFPWPHPMRPSFVAAHLVAAPVFAIAWVALSTALEMTMHLAHGGASFEIRAPLVPFVVLGVWLYLMMAGVIYAIEAAERAAVAESLAVHARLAALRAQLNPHFLFNALHTVVQLIPLEPRRATQAAEQLAGLLRTSLEEDRDLVSVAEEWAFVERYLALERIRFGDRLQVTMRMENNAQDALIPAFALQALVENAVRHGAAPRVEPTELRIHASTDDRTLTVVVRDTGAGADPALLSSGGTGLARLRDRLRTLFGDRGRLTLTSSPGKGFTAALEIPRRGGAGA
jgi:hypothetical protein